MNDRKKPTSVSIEKLVLHLKAISDLEAMSDDANPFRAQAFQRAAMSLAMLPATCPVGVALKAPGVGDSTRLIILQFAETGTSDRYVKLATPPALGALTMTVIKGIGPRTALKMWHDGYKGLDDLFELAARGMLPQPMLDRVLAYTKMSSRHPLEDARSVANTVANVLRNLHGVTDTRVCGSIRRGKAFVKDADIVVEVPNDSDRHSVIQAFLRMFHNGMGGDTRASAKVSMGGLTMPVDIWLVRPEAWGAALNHTTGSKEHNVRLRTMAKSRGWTVSEYGVFEGTKRLGGRHESDLYTLLGVPFVKPEDRTE